MDARRLPSRVLTGLLAHLLLAPVVFLQTLPPGVRKTAEAEGASEYIYPNGLRVLLVPYPSSVKVTVDMTYFAGSRHESPGAGMAHLLEHIMSRATTGHGDIKGELTSRGGSGSSDASYDRTSYYETIGANDADLRWAIQMEGDRMLNGRIDQESLTAATRAVLSEMEEAEKATDRFLEQRVMAAAYVQHGYGRPVEGRRGDIENATVGGVASFYREHYRPDNGLLTISGRFDQSRTLAWVAETFGHIPRPKRPIEPRSTPEPAQDGERLVVFRGPGDMHSIKVLYHIPAGAHPDAAIAQVLAGILGETPSGQLHKALVAKKDALSSSMDAVAMHDPGWMLATIQLSPAQSLEKASQSAIATMDAIAAELPAKADVERVKAHLLKQIELDLANPQATAIGLSDWASRGDWRLLFLNRDRIKSVTPEDVQRVAGVYLKPANRTLAKHESTAVASPVRIPPITDLAGMLKDLKGGEPDSMGEELGPSPSDIESHAVRSRLESGMKVVLLPKKTAGGGVAVVMTLRFGDEKQLSGKVATARLTANMLMRGTKNKTRLQIQNELDRLETRMNVTSDGTSVTVTQLTSGRGLPGALRLLAEVLREPAFVEREFDRVRRQRNLALEASRTDPGALAAIMFEKRLHPYPSNDFRYTRTPEELIGELKSVTLEDVRQFHQQFYGASFGEFAAVGQFDRAEAERLIGELFGKWKSPSGYQPIAMEYRKPESGIEKVETPDQANSMFMAGFAFRMSDEDPDYAAMMLAHSILAGSGGSRLFKRIREKERLSYEMSAQFLVPAIGNAGRFVVSIVSNPQNSLKVEASFRDELTRVIQDGFSAEEVMAAKKLWLKERTTERSHNQTLAKLLATRISLDRTLEFDEALAGKVWTVTPERVNSALRLYFDPVSLVIVEAGFSGKTSSRF